MSEKQTHDLNESISVLADDVRSYDQFRETINERARELGSMALTESIKEGIAREFGLSTQRPIQLQIEQSQLTRVCKFIKEYLVPKNIMNRF